MPGEPSPELEDCALEIFSHALRLRRGYDFSGYGRASLKRRTVDITGELGVARIGDLIPRWL